MYNQVSLEFQPNDRYNSKPENGIKRYGLWTTTSGSEMCYFFHLDRLFRSDFFSIFCQTVDSTDVQVWFRPNHIVFVLLQIINIYTTNYNNIMHDVLYRYSCCTKKK